MKKTIPILIALGISYHLLAQTDVDALRYSQLTFGGTARGMGISGAFGALGADFSALSINPGGIGLYRNSEIMFTPAIFNASIQSDFLYKSNTERKYNFNFSNWGMVLTSLNTEKGNPKTSGWITYSFAIGSNRLNNFHQRFYFSGYNTNNSLLDRYVEDLYNGGFGTPRSQLDDKSAFPFGAALAYWGYLINPKILSKINDSTYVYDSLFYTSVIPNGNIQQSGTMTSKGNMDEYLFSFGGNYNNKLYLGATLSFPYLRYLQEYSYTEEDISNTVKDSIYDFKSFTLSENLKTTGMGINLKFGMIYKMNDWVRLGGAIHTPTYFSLKDDYSTNLDPQVSANEPLYFEQDKFTSTGDFEYGLTTPWRLVGSMALIFKKAGFLSVDYEWVDYGQAFFNFNQGSTEDEFAAKEVNKTILNKYGPASNLRIGGEGTYNAFRFRAGYSWYSTPFQPNIAEKDADNSRTSISFGIGMRENDYYMDFAYVHTVAKEFYLPYSLSSETTAGVTKNIVQNNFLMTWGLKF